MSEQQFRVPRPSRAEVETLCLLCAIGTSGRTLDELVAVLKVAPAAGPIVEAALQPLIDAGALARVDGRFQLTAAAQESLSQRMAALGVTAG